MLFARIGYYRVTVNVTPNRYNDSRFDDRRSGVLRAQPGHLVDSDLVMRIHVCRTMWSCFAALSQLSSTRHLVLATVFQSLVAALVQCRLDYGNGTLVGLPAYLVRRLQSVRNADARLVFRLRRSDHITDALVSLHWLRVPKRIIFKIAVQTYRALHGDAPQYLRLFTPIADISSRQRLRSSSSDDLLVPVIRLPTIGRRTFLVAGARTWNDLPVDVASAPSLLTFRKRLKLHLFRLSYPGISLVLWIINCFSLWSLW